MHSKLKGAKKRVVKTHSFNGISYDVEFCGRLYGITTSPSGKGKPNLVVCEDPNTLSGLETIIHESLHACSFLKSETRVTETARDIARFLWRLGFRKVK